MTRSRIMHSLLLAGGLIVGFVLSCVPVLTGAPCRTNDNCPSGQVCGPGFTCDVGTGGDGSSDGGAVDGGGGTVADGGPVFTFDAGRGEGTSGGSCFDGKDNDNDGTIDCADSDCVTQPCRVPTGFCDAIETCVAGTVTCPADAFAPTTRRCGATAGCGDGTLGQPSFCDGAGSCNVKTPVSCNGYACASGVCKTSCTAASDCDSYHRCSNGVCINTGVNGASCTAGTECMSGHCAGQRCCNDACKGDCDSCDNTTGSCSPVAAGGDPKGKCGEYACNGNGSCATACGGAPVCGNPRCKSDTLCVGAACTAKKADGVSCEADCECSTGRCTAYYVDGDNDGYGTAVTSRRCGTGAIAGYSTNPGDCNDLDQGVNPNAVEGSGDGIDSNCDRQELCFVDGDGDGFRSFPETTEVSSDLTCASGHLAPKSMPDQDHCDKDANAKPGVTAYSASMTNCNDYDWNSDGLSTPQYGSNYDCSGLGRCRAGWAAGTSVPKCAIRGSFIGCTASCSSMPVPKLQQQLCL